MRKLILTAAMLLSAPAMAQQLVSGRYNTGSPTLSDGEQRPVRLAKDGQLLARAEAITPQTAQGATAILLSATAANLASVNVVNSTTAGFLVAANLAAIPASGTALGPTVEMYCMPVAASAGLRDSMDTPFRGSVGWVLLFSTSCTTYTPVSPAPIVLTGALQ